MLAQMYTPKRCKIIVCLLAALWKNLVPPVVDVDEESVMLD